MHNLILNLKTGKIDYYFLSLAHALQCKSMDRRQNIISITGCIRYTNYPRLVFYCDDFYNFKLQIREAKYYSGYVHNTNTAFNTYSYWGNSSKVLLFLGHDLKVIILIL